MISRVTVQLTGAAKLELTGKVDASEQELITSVFTFTDRKRMQAKIRAMSSEAKAGASIIGVMSGQVQLSFASAASVTSFS